ncbi:YfhO family protein, partial [bacterium]|nr:YfhO family protein [bacterium]
MYVGKNIFGNSGRNWKFIAETELNVQEREKVLFSYRETMHPYAGLLYSPLSGYGHFGTSNLMPPLSNKVASNTEVIKLMGVKYIISADEKIESPSLVYRGECFTKDSSGVMILGSDGGTMYIYELMEPYSIAFLVDQYKKANLAQSLKTIYENRNHPWINNEVYLEEDLGSDDNSNKNNSRKSSNLIENKVSIERETFNEIQLNISTPREKFLVLSYIYRPNWKAFIGSDKLKIYRAYGGFMAIKVPPGNNVVKLKYTPIDLYSGLFLTLFAFLIPFLPSF